jgi:hypothetical protein
MQTMRRAAAVLIYPALLCLGVACERADPPTSSPPTRAPRADLTAATPNTDWVTRALLGLDQLVVDPTTSLVQPDDPDDDAITVVPFEFDPNHTSLVRAFWLRGTGCPTDATSVPFGGSPMMFSDAACPSGMGDPKDKKNEGLLLAKTGPTTNFASAGAVLNGVKGIMLTELGYDIRKGTAALNPVGSHCGSGAPRFNVVLASDPPGTVHFVGCNSPPATVASASAAWLRLRWGAAELAAAFPPIAAGSEVSSITIIFDEGTDLSGGPDMFGLAVLDNIDINGTLIGRGPGN